MSVESNLTVKDALDKLSTCKTMTVAEKEQVDNLSDKVTTQLTFHDVRFIENLYHEHLAPVTRGVSGGRSIPADVAKVVDAVQSGLNKARGFRDAVKQHLGKKGE